MLKRSWYCKTECIGVKEPFGNSQKKALWESESGGETGSCEGVRYAKMGKSWEAMQVEWKVSTVLGKGSRAEFNPWELTLFNFRRDRGIVTEGAGKPSFLPVLNLLEQGSQEWFWLVNGKEMLSLISGAATHYRFWVSTIHILEPGNPQIFTNP